MGMGIDWFINEYVDEAVNWVEAKKLIENLLAERTRECAEIAEAGAKSLVDYARSLEPKERANAVRQTAVHLRLVGSTIRERFGLEKGGENA